MLFEGETWAIVGKAVAHALLHGQSAVRIGGKPLVTVQKMAHNYCHSWKGRKIRTRTRKDAQVVFIWRRGSVNG